MISRNVKQFNEMDGVAKCYNFQQDKEDKASDAPYIHNTDFSFFSYFLRGYNDVSCDLHVHVIGINVKIFRILFWCFTNVSICTFSALDNDLILLLKIAILLYHIQHQKSYSLNHVVGA